MKSQNLKAMFANPPAPSAVPPVPVEVLDDDMGGDAAPVAASAPAPAPQAAPTPAPQAAPASAPVPAQASVPAAAPPAKAKVNKTTCKNTVTIKDWTDGKFVYGCTTRRRRRTSPPRGGSSTRRRPSSTALSAVRLWSRRCQTLMQRALPD